MNIEKGQDKTPRQPVIEDVSAALNLLLCGKQPAPFCPVDYPKEYHSFIERVNELIDSISEIRKFILPLSHGKLSVDPPNAENYLASPFKELHSQLRNLVWQVQQVAKGDFSQRVDFMGDFSEAFNNMVEALEEKSNLVGEHITLLEREANWLRESQAQYVAAMQYSPGGIYIFDPETKGLLEANKQFQQMLGYREDEIILLTVFDLYHDEISCNQDLELIQSKSLHNISSRAYRRKSGESIEVDINTCWIIQGQRRIVITHIQDVTEHNQEQKILSKYRILLEHARDILLFVRPDGAIVEANRQAEIAYGYERTEILSMTMFDLLSRDSKQGSGRELDEVLSTGILFETIHCRKDGSTFPVEVSLQGTELDGETLFVNVIRDITKRKGIQDELLYLATHDALTRVPNRYLLEETISLSIARKDRRGALLFIDIDNFKVVNDTLGHYTGDQLLVNMVTLLRNKLRKEDFLARLGGDEFAVLLDGVNVEEAKAIAEKLRKAIESAKVSLNPDLAPLTFSISIGIALLDSGSTVSDILSQADYLLYQAKAQGRNRVVSPQYGDNTKDKLHETSQIIQKIRVALEKEQFILYFQPIVDSTSGQIIHHEGLIRLVDHDGRVIMPGEFISVAERFGIMSLIDRRVINLAFAALTNYPDLKLFINISGASLGDEALLNLIEQNIDAKGIDPSRLGFEITETAAVRDIPQAELWIRRLKEIGCLFALDDFGIGFSSFFYLQYLPADFVKIDGSYVRDMDTNERHRVLVQALNTVAISFGKKTIAEFVENGEVLTILKEYKVNLVQGYYLGRPEPEPLFKLTNHEPH